MLLGVCLVLYLLSCPCRSVALSCRECASFGTRPVSSKLVGWKPLSFDSCRLQTTYLNLAPFRIYCYKWRLYVSRHTSGKPRERRTLWCAVRIVKISILELVYNSSLFSSPPKNLFKILLRLVSSSCVAFASPPLFSIFCNRASSFSA